jgi:phospholipase C
MRTTVTSSSAVLLAGILFAGCGVQQTALAPVAPGSSSARVHRASGPSSSIQYVIIIVQENRTPDNLFQGLPGANIASSGLNSRGQQVALHPVPLEAQYDPNHTHPSFLTEYDGGNMDGFDRESITGNCQNKSTCAYGYVPQSESQPYLDLATQYAFADNMFGTNQGPSFPAHQYLISGTSTVLQSGSSLAAENPYKPGGRHGGGGCDAQASELVTTINASGYEGNPVYPCFDRPTLGDLLDTKGVSWRYYEMKLGTGLWYAYDAIQHIRFGPDYANVLTPSQKILKDISGGNLAHVSWVVPDGSNSDHSGKHSKGGPAWVTSIVNAVGSSQYWNNSAVFVVWDDWGGWYDHVAPPVYTSYELGMRVPLIIVSPYAKSGYVSHTQYEFGSILKFVEETFNLGSLNTTDARANSLDDSFNFGAPKRKFVRIHAPPFGIVPGVPDSD